MKYYILTAICLFFIFISTASVLSSTYELNIDEITLNNGLKVILLENHTVPLVTIEIASKNGSFTETPEYNGLSHLYEHMFFKGNKVIPNQTQYKEKIRELGIDYNGITSTESVRYFFTLPSYNLENGLKFMNNAIRNPLFDKAELDKEIKVVLEEYNMGESKPYSNLYRQMNKRLFSQYYHKVNTIGDREVITNATREKMLNIQKKYYIPNNCALIIAGDINKNETLKLSKEIFGNWEKDLNPFIKDPPVKHPPLKETQTFVFNQKVNNASIIMKWYGASVLDNKKDTFIADVCSRVISLPTSKTYKKLVESAGIAVSMYLGSYNALYSPTVSFSATVTPSNVMEAKKIMIQEINKMKEKDYITEDEIERAEKAIEVSYLFEQEEVQDFALLLGGQWATNGLGYYKDYLENIYTVKKDNVIEFLKTYVIGKPYVMGIMVSEEDQKKYNIN